MLEEMNNAVINIDGILLFFQNLLHQRYEQFVWMNGNEQI
jgi:hypothetical protein